MIKKESRTFYMSVEGINCETLYFMHLAKLINESGSNRYNLKVNPKVASPMAYAKRMSGKTSDKKGSRNLPYIHIQDIEDYYSDYHRRKFFGNIFNQTQRGICCISNKHDYLGDGTIFVENELEAGKTYTFIKGSAEAYGNMVFMKEVPSRFGFQAYLFEEPEPYDAEEYLRESRKWLMSQLEKSRED